MSVNLVLLGLVAALFVAGVHLLLERSLTRVLLGVLLLGNGANVLLLSTGGPAGNPPIYGRGGVEEMSDPLAQAMILTAIVITLGMTAFLLAIIYRSWVLDRQEDLVDDPEDVRVAKDLAPHGEFEVAPGETPYDSGDDSVSPGGPERGAALGAEGDAAASPGRSPAGGGQR